MQFFKKTSQRKYIALVWGTFDKPSGTIVGNVGRNPKDRQQMTVFPDGSAGKPAVTHYNVIENLGYVSVVECILETGRTHQIRVHMSFLGWPLFADEKYLNKELAARDRQYLKHHFLHAQRIVFKTFAGEEIIAEAPLPEDCEVLLKGLSLD